MDSAFFLKRTKNEKKNIQKAKEQKNIWIKKK